MRPRRNRTISPVSVTNKINNQMNYKQFDNKYNKRDFQGVCTHASIIGKNKEIIFQGTVEECMDFHDNHLEVEWKDHEIHRAYINGIEVVVHCFGATNIGESIYNQHYKQLFD